MQALRVEISIYGKSLSYMPSFEFLTHAAFFQSNLLSVHLIDVAIYDASEIYSTSNLLQNVEL
ncbi:hypothetical protein S2091_0983 [Solimicrobium silvestre]|uniref:Uncharacterized protein n=1 Tax=Solimicrobium silvestre TaxID=2099400 RepID=A0A2S9H303_9BURK|nr:hypothetical protein S2091_0983 [Solimicrobium silvestre]